MGTDFDHIIGRLRDCTLCAERLATTATAHQPHPVLWFKPSARILIAGRAPSASVHHSRKPFTDPPGDKLRGWMGLSKASFFDLSKVAVVPMAFCFPGFNSKGVDLPPPKRCADEWRDVVLNQLSNVRLTILVGGYAQKWHLGQAANGGVMHTVQGWRDFAPDVYVLPHPSWRNTGWLRKNTWFESELIPSLRARVNEVLHD